MILFPLTLLHFYFNIIFICRFFLNFSLFILTLNTSKQFIHYLQNPCLKIDNDMFVIMSPKCSLNIRNRKTKFKLKHLHVNIIYFRRLHNEEIFVIWFIIMSMKFWEWYTEIRIWQKARQSIFIYNWCRICITRMTLYRVEAC